jgi:hypothetical protein
VGVGDHRVPTVSDKANGWIGFIDLAVALAVRLHEIDGVRGTHRVDRARPLVEPDQICTEPFGHAVDVIHGRGPSAIQPVEDEPQECVAGPRVGRTPDNHARTLRELSHRHRAITGLGLIQNLRRGHHELAIETPRQLRVTAAFTELARAI